MHEETVVPGSEEAVLVPEGDLVSLTLPALRAQMRGLVDAGVRRLTLDLDKVRMVDSAGLGLLISAHNSLKRVGGDITVVRASKDILQLFQTMRIHQHFSVSGK